MDLSLNEAQQMLKDNARRFMDRECSRTLVRELEATPSYFSADIWKKVSELGWAGLAIPEEYGGSGAGLLDLAVLVEEMGRVLLPGPFFSTAVMATYTLLEAGSDAQKKDLLPRIASGELIAGVAITEADYGWGPQFIKEVKASKQGSGYVLDGTKLFVPDIQVAQKVIVAARTGDGAEDVTLFVVDSGAKGVAIRRLSGFFGGGINEMVLDKVQVADSDVVGKVNGGWKTIESVMQKAVPVLCSYMVGGMSMVLDLTVDYSRTRVQFGVPVGTFQRVQDHNINIVNGLDASRWTNAEAIWKVENNKPGASAAVSLAKAVASDAFHETCIESQEVHAGMGVMREYGLYLYAEAARTLYSYLGDPSFHRENIATFLEG